MAIGGEIVETEGSRAGKALLKRGEHVRRIAGEQRGDIQPETRENAAPENTVFGSRQSDILFLGQIPPIHAFVLGPPKEILLRARASIRIELNARIDGGRTGGDFHDQLGSAQEKPILVEVCQAA
jgi:hypothetical protein